MLLRVSWYLGQGEASRARTTGFAQARGSNPTLLFTENSLLTVPLGPSEARNTDTLDTLDKLRQAVCVDKVSGGGEV